MIAMRKPVTFYILGLFPLNMECYITVCGGPLEVGFVMLGFQMLKAAFSYYTVMKRIN